MEQYFCTFKYYDKEYRRLAVFCRYINPLEAELFTLTCSEQDQFDKAYARRVYEAYLNGDDLKFEFHKPVVELITIQPERREIWTLLNYCRERYYAEQIITVPLQMPVLYNEATGDVKGFITVKI